MLGSRGIKYVSQSAVICKILILGVAYLVSLLFQPSAPGTTIYFHPPLFLPFLLSAPFHIQLLSGRGDETSRLQSYNCNAPIGTGRYNQLTVLAQSDPACTSEATARKSLALSIIRNKPLITRKLEYYDLVTNLYSAADYQLQSFLRAIRLMGEVTEEELEAREALLQEVGEWATLEVRVERFLLTRDMEEVSGFVKVLEDILWMDRNARSLAMLETRAARNFLWDVAFGRAI